MGTNFTGTSHEDFHDVVLGIVYPLADHRNLSGALPAAGERQPGQAGGKVIGSELIGAELHQAGVLPAAASAAGEGYDAANSGGSNFGPDEPEARRPGVERRSRSSGKENPDRTAGRFRRTW